MMNFLANFFEFVFWQDKPTCSTFTAYFSCFFQFKFIFWHTTQKIDFNFLFWQVKSNEVICILHLCFDRKNPANWFEFLLWHENSNRFIWICVLTKEINLINIYRLLIIFFQICFLTVKIQKIELKFLIWQVKSNEFICICVLTGKIQQIDLNFCFDM